MSQQAYPKMATIRPRLVRHIDDSVSFSLSAPGMEDIVVCMPSDDVESTHDVKYGELLWNSSHSSYISLTVI